MDNETADSGHGEVRERAIAHETTGMHALARLYKFPAIAGIRRHRRPVLLDIRQRCEIWPVISVSRDPTLAAGDCVGHIGRQRSCGRVAEGGGLLNRYRVVKPYRGFESLRLRHSASPSELRRIGIASRQSRKPSEAPYSRRSSSVGKTTDLKRRLIEHTAGKSTDT